MIIDYNGHGHIQRWAHEQIWTNNDINGLTNSAKLPVVLSMTCLDGFWFGPHQNGTDVPFGPSLIEEMVRAENRGAVAAFSLGGLGVSTGHDDLQEGLFRALYHDDVRRLGILTLAAKLNLYRKGANYDLLNTFTILGDPALVLAKWNPMLFPIMRK